MAIQLDRIELPNGATVADGSQIIVLTKLTQFGGNPDAGTQREVDEILVAEQSASNPAGQVVISFSGSPGSFSQIRLAELSPRVKSGDILVGES